MKEFFFMDGQNRKFLVTNCACKPSSIDVWFPRKLKILFFEKSIEEIENLNSNFEFENPIKNTKKV